MTQKEAEFKNRVNLAKSLIDSNCDSALLNNVKWKEIFESVESIKCEFRLKLLTNSLAESNWVSNILELENDAILTDNYELYGFINFFEIEYCDIKKSDLINDELKSLNLVYIELDKLYRIYGYHMK